MGRRAKRRPIKVRAEAWRPVRDEIGRWTVVNEQGDRLFRSSDPVRNMEDAYLVAQVPVLREALEELARRLMYLETPYTRDHDRARWAWSEIAASRPPAEMRLRAMEQRDQLELDLQHEVA